MVNIALCMRTHVYVWCGVSRQRRAALGGRVRCRQQIEYGEILRRYIRCLCRNGNAVVLKVMNMSLALYA